MIKIQRLFTKAGQNVYDTCSWKKVHTKIVEMERVIFELKDAEFPEHYSQTACDIVASKYFRRAGVPENTMLVPEENVPIKWQRSIPAEGTTFTQETSLKDCIDRMVGHWTYWAAKMNLVDDLDAFSDELKYMILHQIWSPNSPQWFNAGLQWAYGVKPKNEGYYTINGEYKDGCYEQMHACFIQPVEDAMFGKDSIFEALNNEARIFKKGSGTGTNFSKLRAKGERLSGGGKSSGVQSYLRIFDRSADSIKSGGTTRRSAKMVILDLDHPDIEEFINWKSLEETKVASLITGSKLNKRYLDAIVKDPKNDKLKALALRRGVETNYIDRAVLLGNMGYSSFPMALINNDFNGDGYSTVSGQNSNNTVSITDAFFKCLDQGLDWHLITRLPSKSQKNWKDPTDHPQGTIYKNGANLAILKDKFYDIVKSIPSHELMEQIAFNAWQSADPGVHFRTTINDWHTCKADGEIVASNPCSEYLFLDNTACNLSSHRITKYMDGNNFDVEAFKHAVRLGHLVLDISVESALLPSKGIAEGTAKYRTTGMGYADIGALLMKMGIAYDSEEGRAWIAGVTSLMTSECYKTSSELAKEKGPYEAWERNKEHHMNVITNHLWAAGLSDDLNTEIDPDRLDISKIPKNLADAIIYSWQDVAKSEGFRNAHVTVLAPTGTIGIQMDCDTTGIEPDFSLKKWKKLSGGGYIAMVNQSVPEALAKLGYTTDQVDSIISYYDGEKKYPDIDPELIKKSMHVSQLGLPEKLQAKIYGHGTLKGSILKPEHQSVFDCANEIHWKGHILAMAAAQPFLSGSISKTINMPHNATVEDIKAAYMMSHAHALKCNAVYRDGSKLSQPLNLKLSLDIATELPSISEELNELFTSGRGTRQKPPARRAGWTDEFEVNGFKYYLRHNINEHNKLIEVWIDAPNENSSVRTALNTMCRFISKGLQYGMPIEEVVDTFVGIQQDPRGLVKHENIKVCKSIYDAIGRFIAYMYLGQKDAAEVQTDMLVSESDSTYVPSTKKVSKECPRCASTDISAPSSCKNKCKVCGHEWGGCGE